MTIVQEFVDALRLGQFKNALGLAEKLNTIYESVLNQDQTKIGDQEDKLGNDELVQLFSYELAQTDINEGDLASLNFLNNFLGSQTELSGIEQFKCTSFFAAAKIAVSVKKSPLFGQIIEMTDLGNKTQIKEFIKDSSPYSILVARSLDQMESLTEIYDTHLDNHAMLTHLCEMDDTTIGNFTNDLKLWESPSSDSDEKAPRINYVLFEHRKSIQSLTTLILNYKNHLKEELMQDGYSFEKGHLVTEASEIEIPPRVIKLSNSLKELETIRLDLKDILTTKNLHNIHKVMEFCKNNQPDWFELRLQQQILDVVTLGILPLVRYLSNPEKAVKQQLESVAKNAQISLQEKPDELHEMEELQETDSGPRLG